jgi:DNA-binding MarR family transcriptional regulator
MQPSTKISRCTTAGSAGLPLSALLSQVLVAFIIEIDNESEHRMPHRTTNHGSKADSPGAPWLVSLAMWENCMRYVGEQGVRVRDLQRLARTTTNLNGMERWGNIVVGPVVGPERADRRTKPPRGDWLIRATPAGRRGQEIWRALFGVIEQRWQVRFGKEEIAQLREALCVLLRRIDLDLPDCPPMVGYGLLRNDPEYVRKARGVNEEDFNSLPLSALLSRVLLAFAIEFEHESDLSLALSANAVRVLDDTGVAIRDLPRLSGVSKELIKVSLGFLQKRGYIAIVTDPAAKGKKSVRLTSKGRRAQRSYHQLVGVIEERWQARFGKDSVRDLRHSLERLVGEATMQRSPLARGLEPYPDGWRASVPKPDTLPHYPVVTHRGGFPDGS